MIKNPVGYYGAQESVKDTDFRLGALVDLKKPPHTYQELKTQYAQNDVGAYSCTVHAAMGAYTDLTGKVFTKAERQAIWDKALTLGAKEDYGWSINEAVDLVRREQKNVTSFRMDLIGDDAMEALKKGYSLVAGFRGNRDYNKDRLDGVLDNTKFGNTTYGHAIRLIREGADLIVVDNYPGTGHNTYKIALANLRPLVSNGVFFASAYVFTPLVDDDKALRAKIKGLDTAIKVEISRSTRRLNELAVEVANLKNEPADHFIVSIS